MLPPMLAHELRLTGEDTELPDWCLLVLSYCVGCHRFQTALPRGARSSELAPCFGVESLGPWWAKPGGLIRC
jgi:hypothetical protein